ncbi:uncharacterized protein LOC112560519 [Pomacea canaliculata]|uniref:uncharacterized protein LOC112560519 n=1 Tax=Pomacea canaliculata TaxID=400727 RepID=UPI000D72DF6E|nr:uncharacterized protein LOC112560519 [Pomacea canaliculata]
MNCPKGSYQPQKSQDSCIQCPPGNTTLLTGQIYESACIDDCPDGTAYSMVSNECERCIIGYYRKKTETVSCVKCSLGKTTLSQGASSCIDLVEGTTSSPSPVIKKFFMRTIIRMQIEECSNTVHIAAAIRRFILNRLLSADAMFPQLCASYCQADLSVRFIGGCLSNSRRKKRSTDQDVLIQLANVTEEVLGTGSSGISVTERSQDVVTRAFYDTTQDASLLTDNLLKFVAIINTAMNEQCNPGQRIDGTSCVDCSAGYNSTNGTSSMCTPCEMNTYQDTPGQASCKPCSANTYSNITASTSSSNCISKKISYSKISFAVPVNLYILIICLIIYLLVFVLSFIHSINHTNNFFQK